MRACWQCKRIFDLFFKVYGLTGADSHFQVTRPAKHAACHGNGKAKQNKQGEEKEKVTDAHASPFPCSAMNARIASLFE
jgi:hypothetical protein